MDSSVMQNRYKRCSTPFALNLCGSHEGIIEVGHAAEANNAISSHIQVRITCALD
jgi:hypothetical protein